MKRYNFFILLLVYVFLLIFLAGCSGNGYIPVPPQEQITPGGMAYVWYDWPQLPVNGFYNFDVLLTIDVDPGVQSAYYWAHQFGFKNGDGGYMGLQTNGYIQGKWVGKMAIFSIWDALEAEPGLGASSEQFTGEGEGWNCRIPYNWVEGRTYCLRIWELCCAEKPEEDEWWGAWITDTSSNQETYIGKIKVPGSWKWLDNSSVVWVEYYGQVNDCASTPYSKARFEQPTADNGDFMPQKLTSGIGTTCTNAQITLLGNQGVSFEIGGSTANYAPVISNLTANPSSIDINQTTTVTCTASDPDGDSLTYNWTKTGGTFEGSTSSSSITWRAPSTEGNYTVKCEVSDGEASDSKSVNISVGGSTGSTVSIIEVFPETMNIRVGNSQSIESITAHYDNGSTADIALNACTYISSNTGIATVDIGVITAIALGSATITVVYTEGYTEGDITEVDTVAVTVSADVNHPPVITSTAVTSATKDEPYSYDVNATDSDGDTPVYSLTTKPSGMTINSTTGLIAWTPTTSGDYNVTVKASDGELFDTQSFTVIVEESGITTRIIRLAGDLSFGSVNVGSTSQRTLTIYNDGTSTLTVSSISYPTGFSGSWSGTISAGSSRDVTVTFAPTQAITYSGTLTVNSDKTSGTNTKSVSGTGTQIITTRIIRLAGDLSFGSVNVGSTSQRTLTIYNDGNSTLTVSSISYPTGFSGSWSGTISAGSSRDVTVTFAPTQAITYSGTVTVNSDKTSGTNTKSVSGTGTQIATTIIVTSPNGGETWNVGGTRNITWTVSGDISHIDHFILNYGTNGSCNQYYIDTTSSASRSYSWIIPNTPSTQCKIGVWAMDTSNNSLAFDASDGLFTISQAITTRIIRLAGDLSFGSVNVGSTSQRTLTIYNDGNSSLTVTSISYPTGFSGSWSGTISAGSSRNVTVTFAPTQAITYSGTLTVNSDKTSGTNTKSVSGTGTSTPTLIFEGTGSDYTCGENCSGPSHFDGLNEISIIRGNVNKIVKISPIPPGFLYGSEYVVVRGCKWLGSSFSSSTYEICNNLNTSFVNGYKVQISNNQIQISLSTNKNESFKAVPWNNVEVIVKTSQSGTELGKYTFKWNNGTNSYGGIFPRVESAYGQCVWWAIRRFWEEKGKEIWPNFYPSLGYGNVPSKIYTIITNPQEEYFPESNDVLINDIGQHYAFVESVVPNFIGDNGDIYAKITISEYNYPKTQQGPHYETLYWKPGRTDRIDKLFTLNTIGTPIAPPLYQFDYYISSPKR